MNIIIDTSKNRDLIVHIRTNVTMHANDKVVPSSTQPGVVLPFLRRYDETDEQFERRAMLDPRVIGECVAYDEDTNLVTVKLWK